MWKPDRARRKGCDVRRQHLSAGCEGRGLRARRLAARARRAGCSIRDRRRWEVRPVGGKARCRYEFKLVPPPGDTRRPRRAYMPGFIRSDRLLRFSFESRDPVAAATGSRLGYDDAHAALVVRRRQKAFLHGRDSLTIDGFEAIGPDNAKNRSVTCALYVYDAPPFDQKSSGSSIIKARFVDSSDVFMPAATPAFIDVRFNGDRCACRTGRARARALARPGRLTRLRGRRARPAADQQPSAATHARGVRRPPTH